jgi:hypothetical protein
MGAMPLGIGGILVLLVLSWFTGVDFLSLIGGGGGPQPDSGYVGTTGEVATTPEEEEMVDFVDAVMRDTQRTWGELMAGRYEPTTAVLFREATSSTCGYAQSAVGPFYCPGDRKVYLDLSFFNELRTRFGAPGDFAQAYVLAHEVGHHVQMLTGVESKVRQLQQSNPGDRNELSVLMELQADCFAGVWANHAASTGFLEPLTEAQIADALDAAAAVGDDRIQEATQGQVNPDSWTHGSSAQRQEWFRTGYGTGDPAACDTFDADL